MPLAHSSAGTNLSRICASGRLFSPQMLHDEGLKTLADHAVERELGTAGFVFLYAAPFSFPNSGCGFLFSESLERRNKDLGSATPFDSGGLVDHIQRTSGEPAREFFLRHELPLPSHRDYLRPCLESLYEKPGHYIDGTGPRHDGPLALTGGDVRRWVHEVRIPHQVDIRSPHLKAVFAPRRLALVNEVRSLLLWCDAEGFDVVIFDADRDNDFSKLRSACVRYCNQLLN